jgi:hypothetical protein
MGFNPSRIFYRCRRISTREINHVINPFPAPHRGAQRVAMGFNPSIMEKQQILIHRKYQMTVKSFP